MVSILHKLEDMRLELRSQGFTLTTMPRKIPMVGPYAIVSYRSLGASRKTTRTIWVDLYTDGNHSIYYSMKSPYGKESRRWGSLRPPPAKGTSPVGFRTLDEMRKALQYIRRCSLHEPTAEEIDDRELQNLARAAINDRSLTIAEQAKLARFVHAELLGEARGYPAEYLYHVDNAGPP